MKVIRVLLAGAPAGWRRAKGDARESLRVLAAALVALALWVAAAVPAAAAVVSGTTGLLQVPSADVLPEGRLRLAAGFDGKGLVPSVTYGVFPALEAGVSSRSSGNAFVRVKFAVATETAAAPGLAVGLEDDSLYAVLSRRLSSPGMRVHVGIGSGRPGPVFAGLEYRLRSVAVTRADAAAVAPAVTLLVDYDGRAVALGARLDFATGLTVSGGVRAGHGAVGAVEYGIHF